MGGNRTELEESSDRAKQNLPRQMKLLLVVEVAGHESPVENGKSDTEAYRPG